jgi:hypothetical protein
MGMIVDIHARSRRLERNRQRAAALSILDAPRRVRRLADPAIDETLEPNLRIVVDVRAPT